MRISIAVLMLLVAFLAACNKAPEKTAEVAPAAQTAPAAEETTAEAAASEAATSETAATDVAATEGTETAAESQDATASIE